MKQVGVAKQAILSGQEVSLYYVAPRSDPDPLVELRGNFASHGGYGELTFGKEGQSLRILSWQGWANIRQSPTSQQSHTSQGLDLQALGWRAALCEHMCPQLIDLDSYDNAFYPQLIPALSP